MIYISHDQGHHFAKLSPRGELLFGPFDSVKEACENEMFVAGCLIYHKGLNKYLNINKWKTKNIIEWN